MRLQRKELAVRTWPLKGQGTIDSVLLINAYLRFFSFMSLLNPKETGLFDQRGGGVFILGNSKYVVSS